MNFDTRLTEMKLPNRQLPDSGDFIERFHSRRNDWQNRRQTLRSALIAGVMVLAIGIMSQFQIQSTNQHLAHLDATYLSPGDLIETEQFISEAVYYLISNSDDVWSTVAFLDEIEYGITMGNEAIQ